MDAFIPRTPTVQSWLQDGSLARCEVAYESWLNERGYTASTARNYLGCLVRFASWATNQRLMPEDLSLGLIRCFVDEHLRHCDCPYRVQRSRSQVRAALAQLLPALGAAGIAYVTETPNAEERELNRFDAYLREQRGLSANPRLQRCKILTGLLMLSPQKKRAARVAECDALTSIYKCLRRWSSASACFSCGLAFGWPTPDANQ